MHHCNNTSSSFSPFLSPLLPHLTLHHTALRNRKNILANAIANETDTDFYYLNLVYFDGYSASCLTIILKEVFYQARNHKPATIFIDEVDMLCSENTRDLRTEFLLQVSEMDGEMMPSWCWLRHKFHRHWTDIWMCFQTEH